MRSWFIPVLAAALAATACGTSDVESGEIPDLAGQLDYQVDDAGGLVGTVVMPSGERVRVGSSADATVRTTRVVGEDGTVHLHWDMTLEDDEILGEMGGQTFGRFEDAETDEDLALWRGIADAETGEVLRVVSGAAARELAAAGESAPAFASLEALAAASGYLEEMASPPDPTLDLDGSCACDAECETRGDCCSDGACETDVECTPGDPRCDHLCGDDQFQCEDGICIPWTQECDGVPDCSLGDDEDWCEEAARVSATRVEVDRAACDDPSVAGATPLAGRCGVERDGIVGQNYVVGVGLCEHHLAAYIEPTKMVEDPDDFEDKISACKSRYSAKVYSRRGRVLAKRSEWRRPAVAWATIVTSSTPCVRLKTWSTYRRARRKRLCSYRCGRTGPT